MCCGGRTRTCNLWGMNPTSCRCSTPRCITAANDVQTSAKPNLFELCRAQPSFVVTKVATFVRRHKKSVEV